MTSDFAPRPARARPIDMVSLTLVLPISRMLNRRKAKRRRRVANGTVPIAYTMNSGEESATSAAVSAPNTGSTRRLATT